MDIFFEIFVFPIIIKYADHVHQTFSQYSRLQSRRGSI